MSYTDTLDADDDDAFGDTIQDTLTLSDSAQLREDAKFHEMNRYSSVLTLVCFDRTQQLYFLRYREYYWLLIIGFYMLHVLGMS